MGFSVLYSIVDAKGQPSTTEINLPDAITFANAGIFAAQMALLIDPLLKGVITRIGIAFTVALPGGLNGTPDPASDVEEGALFQWRTNGGYYTRNRIPTFSEDLIVTGGRDVDTADTDVAAFVAAMVSGINLVPAGGTGTAQPSDKRSDDIAALSFAREDFQSSRG